MKTHLNLVFRSSFRHLSVTLRAYPYAAITKVPAHQNALTRCRSCSAYSRLTPPGFCYVQRPRYSPWIYGHGYITWLHLKINLSCYHINPIREEVVSPGWASTRSRDNRFRGHQLYVHHAEPPGWKRMMWPAQPSLGFVLRFPTQGYVPVWSDKGHPPRTSAGRPGRNTYEVQIDFLGTLSLYHGYLLNRTRGDFGI
jgi:hypothetical protein